jgi:hypothetical protein
MDRYCIIGAGSSGLAVLKNFRQRGIPCDCLEKHDDVGGIWCCESPTSTVYRSAHLISSKRLTEFTDFRMPREYPQYPSAAQVFAYLQSYARRFDLYDQIEFNTPVAQVVPRGEYDWEVRLADGTVRRYRGVVIANGHNWDPNWPDIPGEFDGESLHSAQYKTPEVLDGRRVLVVGGGNSGCDIAVESAQHAVETHQSVRRGYHYLPKFLFGSPIDACGETLLRWRIPLWLRRRITQVCVGVAQGSPQHYGLPRPDHKLFQTHPIINSQMLYYVGHGRIQLKPDLDRLCGDRVRFVDGSELPIDAIIYATGFKVTIGFIAPEHLNWRDGAPDLYLNLFHPERDDLFVAGLIQPDSGQWGLVDYQAQLIAEYVVQLAAGSTKARRLQQRKRTERADLSGGIRYLRSPRHRLEVEHFGYRRRLRNLIASLK